METVTSKDRGARPGVKWAVAGVSVLCLAGLIWHFRGQPSSPSGPAVPADSGAEVKSNASETAAQLTVGPGLASTQRQADSEAGARPATGPAKTAAPPLPPAVPQTPVDPAMGALVGGLNRLSGTNVALTPEAVGAWRTNFLDLVQSGSAAIPALRAFLDQKVDYPFSQEAWQTLGYTSARLAAIDALRQIGGPDATAAMEGLLGTTQSPREIAILARNLEEASPGQYRQQALDAARAGLTAAATSTNPQLDVAPLFEVFQHYGDASVIPDLEQATGRWKYYSTIALANLPDGAGIPSILRLAGSASSDTRVTALEMVAQLATTSPDARQFLAAQVANGTIPPNLWPYLSAPLAGDQYYPVDSAITQYPQLQSWSDLRTTHITYGNQNLYNLPGTQNLTAEGMNQRLALVEELLKTTSDPAAVQALQRARDTLTQRATRAAAQPQPGTGTSR